MFHTPLHLKRSLLATCVALSCTAISSPVLAADYSLQKRALSPELADRLQTKRKIEVFVELDVPSVAAYVNAEQRAGRKADARAQRQQAGKIKAQQQRLIKVLEGLGATPVSTLQAGANGIKVRVSPQQMPQLRKLSGVRQVAPVRQFRPLHTYSVPWIGADIAQDAGFDGRDVTIAVIDTGVDYSHAMFGGDAAYAGNDPTLLEAGSFPTAKVTGGYDFAGTSYDASGESGSTIPSPDPDPMDYQGHGSHVAGSAAGLEVAGKLGAGVAPGAKILAVKVFGDGGGSTSLVAEGIEYALDPNGDGAIDDRADIINMSLGSDFGQQGDPSAIAAANAVELGVIVVSAAGNAGNGVPYVHGSPAIDPDSISVAASVAGGVPEFAIPVEGAGLPDRFRAQYAGISPSLDTTGTISGDVALAAPLDACSSIDASVLGKVALIQRGACAFSTKLSAARDAGAIAAIVFNNVGGEPIVMGGSAVDLAGAMISLEDGLAMASALNAGPVRVTFDPDAFFPYEGNDDTLASFSSRGPGNGDSSFKPDLSAPGVGIFSAAARSGSEGRSMSGTSMATPHVAGVSAIMRQAFPDLTPVQIKAMLQNSAVPINQAGPGSNTPYPLTLQGTGRVQVDQAVTLTALAMPGGVSFGHLNPASVGKVQRTVEVENLSSSARRFNIRHESGQMIPGVTLTTPKSIQVPANGKSRFNMELRYDPAKMPADESFYSQSEADGWIILDDGEETLRVGYMSVLDPASGIAASGQSAGKQMLSNRGPSAGVADGFTLLGQDGEVLNDAPNAIHAFGYRTADFGGYPVVQFGLAAEQAWTTFSQYQLALNIDTDEDGRYDYILYAMDYGLLTGGDPSNEIVTALLNLNTGSFLLEYLAASDNNDRIISFTVDQLGSYGFLAEEDRTFDYRLDMISLTDDSYDVQLGSVNLDMEVKVDQPSLLLERGEKARVETLRGQGDYLWLFPGNTIRKQTEIR